ncbi:MAG: carbon-nitrogen hydrolase family protein [Melioribacteraceae bacterium]|nr:carbon-nitrogen hydrolase family protein [Melioribacteraceae bacterium]
MPSTNDFLTVGLAQIAPIMLNREKTTDKIIDYIKLAKQRDCHIVGFGESLLPGYPFWLDKTDGARFDSPFQKKIFSHYLDQSIEIELGHLNSICEVSRNEKINVVLGIVERAGNRGSHSLYCSLVYIDKGEIKSVHRKLMPTYEERLVWSPGDGNGLRVHPLKKFTVGGLNCWENWMPLVRSSLYAQGEDLHFAIWPGGNSLTENITRFVAKEARSFVISVSGLLRKEDIPDDIPFADSIKEKCSDLIFNGGSCIAGPDGEWIIKPTIGKEELLVATIDHNRVREERQNFDPSGHYSRADITELKLNRERQSVIKIID